MDSMTESSVAVQAVVEWAAEYRRVRDELRVAIEWDPSFADWANEQIDTGARTKDECIGETLRTLYDDRVPSFPAAALPSWAAEAEADWWSGGGEVMVMILGRERTSGDVSARLSMVMSVVVDPERSREGLALGATMCDNKPGVGVLTLLDEFTTDAERAADAAVVLAALALDLREANMAGADR